MSENAELIEMVKDKEFTEIQLKGFRALLSYRLLARIIYVVGVITGSLTGLSLFIPL
jgi:hypothetical protein